MNRWAPRKRRGGTPEDAEWNRMVDSLHSVQPANSPGVLTSQGPHGVTRRARPSFKSRTQPSAKQYILKTVSGDYLTCHTYDINVVNFDFDIPAFVEGEEDIIIAKDPKLRESLVIEHCYDYATDEVFGLEYSYDYSAFDIHNRIRTALDLRNNNFEIQMVTPFWLVSDVQSYAPNTADLIYAVPCRTGVIGPDGSEVGLLNISPNRAWAKVFDPPL